MLHAEQMRLDYGGGDKRKTAMEHNRTMEKLGAAMHMPTLNAYNNASQHKLTRSESGSTMTLKAIREQQETVLSSVVPLRLLA
jgi:hypothetical protein